MQHHVDGLAVIQHVLVVAALFAVAVHRQRLVVDGVGDEERDDFLRVLVGTDVVRATGDGDRQAIGHEVGDRHEVAAGLAGGVGAARGHGVSLQRAMIAGDVTVDLIGGDLVIALQPELARGF